ncbi:MAG: argininosuccinate synthase [Candidatus Omnitrophota bacterium]
MKKKIILAYSGGLDTSCCVKWLKDKGYSVICFSANLGSEFSPKQLHKMALASGADKIHILDLQEEFCREYVLTALKANAVYQGGYLLSTALGRPLIAKYLVEVARKENACYVAHGCTGKGNDQVRIELAVKTLNPKLKIIAPLREWELTSRDSEVEYAKLNKIPISATHKKIYSIDKNLWGISIEAGPLEDLESEPRKDSFILTRRPEDSVSSPQNIEIEFKCGVPVKLNKKPYSLVTIIKALNKIGARHSIGRTDMVEDRIVGIKSREIYEAPAAWMLYTAHKELESLVLDREVRCFKEFVSSYYARVVYQGLWFTPIKQSLDSFIEKTQDFVSGRITLKLFKGKVSVVKRSSPNSLYKIKLATYSKKDEFPRNWADGFINIWSMPFIRY